MITSAQDTQIIDLPRQGTATPISQDTASLLWQYRNKNSIAGVPVAQQSQNITFQKQSQLVGAMQPECHMQVFIGYLSPQYKEDVDKYREIKQLAADGVAVIVQQQKQFVAQKNAYMCLVVYGTYKFILNQRYNFYKEDFQDGKN